MDSRFLDVNEHGVLRVPATVWLALALLARYWVLIVIVAVSSRRGSESLALLGDGGVSWPLLVLEVPAFLVALAAGRRVPEAGRMSRLIWRWGRELMAVTLLANLAWTAHLLSQSSYWLPWPELFLASCCVLDLAAVLSVYTNPHQRQLFQEFPAKPTEGATP